MRRGVKIVLTVAGGIAFIGVTAAGTIYGVSSSKLNRKFPLPVSTTLSVPLAQADVARGEHLARSVSACMDCHAPDLGGKVVMDAGPIGSVVATNLTSGEGGVAASFTDEDWVLAIRHGLRRDGTSLLIMPSEAFVHYNDADLAAIIAYVKSVPPVDRELPKSQLRMLGRALFAAGKLPIQVATLMPATVEPTNVVPGPTAEYGAHLAKVGGCAVCHGPDLAGGPAGDPAAPPPPNITPAGNPGKWSEQEFVRVLREGKRPDDSVLSDAMPWKVYRSMSDDELHALWLYLQSVPAKQAPVSH
jgi:cytochrome c553